MAFPRLKSACLTSVLVAMVVASTPSHAAMAVIDVKGLSEAQKQVTALNKQLDNLKDQLKVATDQLDTLKKVRQTATDTLSSIGEMGNISVPSLNFNELAQSIVSDKSCLIPDYKSLMPSIEMEDMDFGSICDRGAAYKSGLIATPEKLKTGSWEEKAAIQKAVTENRTSTVTDVTFKGMGQADQALETASKTLETAQDYKKAGGAAEDMNGRLQVLIEIGVAQLTTQAQTNQLLAQLLKVQSTATINSQVPIESEVAEDAKYQSESED